MNRFCLTLLSLGLLMVLAMTGCRRSVDTVGLTWASRDKYEYTSTVTLPVTLTLVEIYNDEPVWTYDIPAGQSLVVDLDRQGEVELVSVSGKPATRMKWRVYEDLKNRMVDKGVMDLPGVPVMLKVTYRPAPEYPGTYQPGSQKSKTKASDSSDKPADAKASLPRLGGCQSEPSGDPVSPPRPGACPATSAPATGPAGELLAPQ